MRNKHLLALGLLAALFHFSCKKNELSNSTNPALNAAKTSSIKRGEPVVFKFNNASSVLVNWSVTPADSVLIKSSGDSATIVFKSPGRYLVSAQSGSTSSTIGVLVDSVFYYDSSNHPVDSVHHPVDSVHHPVDSVHHPIDSVNHPADTSSIVALTGDQINIIPSLFDSSHNSGIVFSVVTKNQYNCLNNHLSMDFNQSGSDNNINFIGVYTPPPSSCTAGKKQSNGTISIYPIADGTYNLNIKLNGNIYSGSYTKTGKSVKFTWNYNSGVIISPLTIN